MPTFQEIPPSPIEKTPEAALRPPHVSIPRWALNGGWGGMPIPWREGPAIKTIVVPYGDGKEK